MLNSICKVISEKYPDIPIHIMDVPQGFKRPCFLVTLATENSNLLNINVYEDTPVYQIVFFNKRNKADQVYAEGLYEKRADLKALFLLPGAIPIIPIEGVEERQRYAKTTSFSSEVRLAEDSLYTKIGISFTEAARELPYADPIEDVELNVGIAGANSQEQE